ncbi:methyltransferase [Candidatus Woesearchaeota archaeon]|nr:methyltransferase [Candidatus Woesearchaeota archaeon]
MTSKRGLAVALSQLKGFENADRALEQYATDSDLAAELLWHAYMAGRLNGTVIDLGAGTGILAVGAALMGADVIAVEKDENAITILKENLMLFEGTENVNVIHGDVKEYANKGDLVIMNPPFGTKEKHADRVFLERAKTLAPIIYTIHKSTTKGFVHSFCKDNRLRITWEEDRTFPLKRSMEHHKKDREHIEVTLFCLEHHAKNA